MRAIKFRAWDKEEKEWCFNGIGLTLDGRASWLDGAEMIDNIDDNVEIMQYTGYKDITGKEIYEGDIVETTRVSNCIIGTVVMIDGCWCIQDSESSYYRLIPNIGEVNNKIIGNIYEEMVETKIFKIILKNSNYFLREVPCDYIRTVITLKEYQQGYLDVFDNGKLIPLNDITDIIDVTDEFK